MGSNNSQKGFTLVELSIVIVIVGLIVAGITAGQALVKQSQIRALLTQADQIRAATNAFKLQYNGLPGDINNGSSYWTTTCNATGSGASDNYCDGDGNKQILVGGGNTAESFPAWMHITLAKLYPGNFFPTTGAVGILNGNIPLSKFPGVGMSIGFDSGALTGIVIGKNIVLFGGQNTTVANRAFLTPPQAYALDAKADDGAANRGSIYGGDTGAAGGTTCQSGGTYVYATTTTTCTLGFVL